MAQQARNPFGVGHIGLATGHRLHVSGIDEQEREQPFEQVVDRFPVDARTFHRHLRTARLDQPV